MFSKANPGVVYVVPTRYETKAAFKIGHTSRHMSLKHGIVKKRKVRSDKGAKSTKPRAKETKPRAKFTRAKETKPRAPRAESTKPRKVRSDKGSKHKRQQKTYTLPK